MLTVEPGPYFHPDDLKILRSCAISVCGSGTTSSSPPTVRCVCRRACHAARPRSRREWMRRYEGTLPAVLKGAATCSPGPPAGSISQSPSGPRKVPSGLDGRIRERSL